MAARGMNYRDGGDAFPSPGVVMPAGDQQGAYEGMSMRDYFAAKAMAGMVVREILGNDDDGIERIAKRMATVAYGIADAMLEARKR